MDFLEVLFLFQSYSSGLWSASYSVRLLLLLFWAATFAKGSAGKLSSTVAKNSLKRLTIWFIPMPLAAAAAPNGSAAAVQIIVYSKLYFYVNRCPNNIFQPFKVELFDCFTTNRLFRVDLFWRFWQKSPFLVIDYSRTKHS